MPCTNLPKTSGPVQDHPSGPVQDHLSTKTFVPSKSKLDALTATRAAALGCSQCCCSKAVLFQPPYRQD